MMCKIVAIAVLMFGCSLSALAWNCNNPLAERTVVPTGTAGSYGDADGQLALFNGLLYECKVVPPTTPAPPTAPSTSSTSASNSTSGASSTATGGNATSVAGISNSGNSSNSNKNTLAQTQKQQQSNSSTNNNASTATSNGDNSNNSTEVTNIKPAAASAVAPIGFPTAPCLAPFGGAAQSIPGGISFGGAKVDQGCDSRATAQQFALLLNNRVAAAKILCTTKAARRAHLTMEDCLASTPAPVAVVTPVVAAPSVAQPAPIQVTVNVPPAPAAQLVYLTPPQVAPVVAPKPLGDVKPRSAKHIAKPCKVTPALQVPMEK